MPRARALLAVSLLIAVGGARAWALDPDRTTSQYVVTKWGARELTTSSVLAILQTRDHYLWLGTSAGLARFDGARFSFFGDRGTPPLVGGVSSLAEGSDGALYVGTTSGGILQYRGRVLSRLPVGEMAGNVHGIHPHPDGSLWIVAHGRPVYRLSNGIVTNLGSTNIDSPLAIAADKKSGHVYVATGRDGLMRTEDGRAFVSVEGIKDSIQAIHIDQEGAIWLGTPHGLLRLDAGRVQRFTTRDGLSNDYVSAILGDRDGNLWVGTAGGGLNRLSGGRLTHFTTHEGLSSDHVRCLLEDHEGNLWVGTVDGLDRLSDGRFITYGRLEGLRDPVVTAVAATEDGSVWIGMNTGGIARLRDGQITDFRLPPGVGRDAINTLQPSRDGGIWIVVDNGAVFRFARERLEERTPEYADNFQRVRVIVEDEDGPVFFVPRLGPARMQGRRLVPLLQPPPRLGYYYSAHRDPRGTLWLCTQVGLARFHEGKYEVFRRADGLPHDRVRWATGESDGSLWAATAGGLAYIKDGVCRNVTTAEGLPEDFLRLVLDDGLGHLWIASMGRIFRLTKAEIFDLFAGRVSHVSPVTFDTWDGLRATEVGALSNSPGFRDRQGRLWFATSQGVSVVDPSRVTIDDPAPAVVIDNMTVDGRSVEDLPLDGRAGGLGEYGPGRGEVTIDYTALAFRSPGRLRFRHRLEGFDDRWVEASTRRTAYYSNLPPGTYRFAVMASNRDGIWNGQPTAIAFAIRPPFYRRKTFYAACAAIVLGIVALVHRIRVQTMHARLTAIIDERTRIARELHDTLAQGLAGVGIQLDTTMTILPDEPTLARVRRQLEQAHSMIRSSLAEVRRSIWVLRAQTAKDAKDLQSSLAENLAQLSAGSGTSSGFEVGGDPRPLLPDLERNLLRIAHEAVTNAVRHARAGHIKVALHFSSEHVRLRVVDDGAGFDPEAALRRTSGAHFGLVGIAERARSLGGDLSIVSRPGEGTTIECRLPYYSRRARRSADQQPADAPGADLPPPGV